MELYKVTGGSNKVALVTKKLYFEEMKIISDIFSSKPFQGSKRSKTAEKASFAAIFDQHALKTTLKKNFEIGLHVTLINR